VIVEHWPAPQHQTAGKQRSRQETIRDLELIRAAGIEGMEPVFEVLEEYVRD
jgi:hypothetical protein